MLRVNKKTGQARDEGVSIKRGSTSKKINYWKLRVHLKSRGGVGEVGL